MNKLKILVVDDESRMRKLVRDFLVKQNFEVVEAGDGEEALNLFYQDKDIALIILDVMMPKMNGWEVCREIRETSKVPIIMLTAKSDESDELQGFDLGVDEYISKPFSPKILVARVEAILRRTNKAAGEEILETGGIRMDKTAHMVTVDGAHVDLSFKEFELLAYFMENEGIALSREKILNHVWNYDYFGDARTIDTHVKKLRNKMGEKANISRQSGAWATNSPLIRNNAAEIRMSGRSEMKEEKTLKARNSITGQIAGIIIGLVTGTVVLCWLLNTVFLESYYVRSKQKLLINGFTRIDRACEDDKLQSADFAIEFDKICSNSNITIMIIDSDGNVVKSSARDTETMHDQFIAAIFGTVNGAANNIASGEDYKIIRQTDDRLQTEYYVLWGILPDGNLIMMRTPLESIRESVTISNRFLTYVGIIAVILSAVTVVFVTKRVTMPVLELTEISRRMIGLDFDAKYHGNGKNELDQLGEHMNQLSETLERTISELKSANNELKLDNERKTEIDEMRKEFLSNVSHELKTPLALIQGYAEGLQECINDDAESRNFYCDVIIDEADKMNQMVKKLLTLNQLEFGNDTVTIERFDMTELIRGVLGSSAILLEQNGITAEFAETSLRMSGRMNLRSKRL